MITVETKIGDWIGSEWGNTHVVIGATRSGNLWVLENVDTGQITMRISAAAATIEGGK